MPKRMRGNDGILGKARGRLERALMDAIEPLDNLKTPLKHERSYSDYRTPNDKKGLEDMSDDFYFSEKVDRSKSSRKRGASPVKNGSYVMKLFDRSVDLAQFEEDTPLYPICRAWMANRPKQSLLQEVKPFIPPDHEVRLEGAIDLPPPEGLPISRIPALLPEQETHCEINLDFDYDDNPPPSKDNLLKSHMVRWQSIRKKWFDQATLYEQRYIKTQEILNEMDTNMS